ncbi:MAG: alpha/beta fold hydrolase [Pigmentiphaga sp.]
MALFLLMSERGFSQQLVHKQPPKVHEVLTPDGLNLNVQEWGNPEGIEILFIHGAFQSHLSWSQQFNSDLSDDFRIVTYDARGHGYSDKPVSAEYYREGKRWADEVKAVIDQTGLKNPTVVAWSYGGRMISDYLSVYGDEAIAGINFVAALTNASLNAVTAAGPAAVGMMSDDLLTNLESTRAFLRFCFAKQPSQSDFENMVGFNMLNPVAVRKLMGGRPTPYEATLRQIKVPVLVTHGVEDQAVDIGISRYTAATVDGADTSFYEGVGHSPFWEEPDRFNRELRTFARENARQAS